MQKKDRVHDAHRGALNWQLSLPIRDPSGAKKCFESTQKYIYIAWEFLWSTYKNMRHTAFLICYGFLTVFSCQTIDSATSQFETSTTSLPHPALHYQQPVTGQEIDNWPRDRNCVSVHLIDEALAHCFHNRHTTSTEKQCSIESA